MDPSSVATSGRCVGDLESLDDLGLGAGAVDAALVGQRHEFWGGPDERGFRNTGTANYIRWGRGKGDVQRWENSQMMLIPIERDTFGP